MISPLNSNANIRILVIDDEEALCEILKFNLEREGYVVDCAYSAEEALEEDLGVYDLFLVDIMMGEMSGFDFARRLREIPGLETKPVIFCSALGDEDNKVRGLNIGADDYVTKPFVIAEVVARVRAVLRRAAALARNAAAQKPAATLPPDGEPDLVFSDLRVDRNQKLAFIGSEDLGLTRTEYDLLTFFLTHRNRIYSRDELIAKVWGGDVVLTSRTIDTNITRLRHKLGNYGNHIVTRQGFGYGFKENI